MDRDLIRVVIIAVGASIILAMLIWGIIKSRKKNRPVNFYDKQGAFDNVDSKLMLNTEDDEFDVVSTARAAEEGQRLNPEYTQDVAQETELSMQQAVQSEELQFSAAKEEEKILPILLQFSIVPSEGEYFNGPELLDAFDRLGLIYGTVQVFERLDEMNRVDYAVASLLEEGVFPRNDWEVYQCPGIAFFMQPREVDNALAVFNEMITTIGNMGALLQGRILDHKNQELTEEIVNDIAASL